MDDLTSDRLDSLHHVAVVVDDIAAAVAWYQSKFRCNVAYQDGTWAMLDFANCQLALVVGREHPAHVAFSMPANVIEQYGTLRAHRDGTRSLYIADNSGNPIELLADESPAEYVKKS